MNRTICSNTSMQGHISCQETFAPALVLMHSFIQISDCASYSDDLLYQFPGQEVVAIVMKLLM